MTTIPTEWGCCTLSNQDDKYLQCTKCMTAYHFSCVYPGKTTRGNSSDTSKNWTCPSCREATPKAAKNEISPARQVQNTAARPTKRPALSSPPGKQDSPVTRDGIREIMEEVLQKHMSDFKKQFCRELDTVKDELKSVKQAMEFVNDKFEDIMKVHNDTQAQVKILQERDDQTQSIIQNLNIRINQLEQNARSKNIEIQCVPEKKTENLVSIVKEIGNAVGYEIKDDNILRITRTAKLNPENSRPRSIVVEFNTPYVRDSLLASTIKFNKRNPSNKLNSSHLGLTGQKTPVFIMEHLSPQNKALHAAARQAAKEKGFKFVWVRSGRIFMRQSEDSGYVLVRDSNTLANLK